MEGERKASEDQVSLTERFWFIKAQRAFMVHHSSTLPQAMVHHSSTLAPQKDFEKGFSKNYV
jgi:CRISPR/Cas system CSM-associated protein Csm4 (group 5 of RAMP superfamily)